MAAHEMTPDTTADHGECFPATLLDEIQARFHHVHHDADGRRRLYFENAGGSLRLKRALDAFARVDAIPDNAERIHDTARQLRQIQDAGTDDIRTMLNARGGTVHASLTASGAMFDMIRAIAENVPGTNLVTTVLEHPSSYDAMAFYAERLGRELRVAGSNRETGGIDVDAIVELIDADTTLLSVIHASNISGAKLDIAGIVRRARAIKPDLYIVVDAVQHAPHGLIDLQAAPVDGITVAPYKCFGCRGAGFSWLSERAALLPHHKLAGKPPAYWDLGSAALWQFAVMTEIVDYICWIGDPSSEATGRRARFVNGIERIERHERALLARMLDGSDAVPGLRRIPGVEVLLDHPDLTRRDLIVALAFDRLGSKEAVAEYEKRGVIVYERVASSLYSKRMLDSFGIDGAVRVSPLHCHGYEDIDAFLVVTQAIIRDLPERTAAPRKTA